MESNAIEPVYFDESNYKYLGRGLDGTEPKNVKAIDDIYVWTDGSQIVSKWRIPIVDRLKILLFGHVWVGVLSNKFYPTSLSADRTYFETPE